MAQILSQKLHSRFFSLSEGKKISSLNFAGYSCRRRGNSFLLCRHIKYIY